MSARTCLWPWSPCVLALALALAGGARAQDAPAPETGQAPAASAETAYAFAWDPRSGDDWVDARLGEINAYAQRYREAFIDEVARYRDAPRALVQRLVVERRWAPGDVYYACTVAQALGRPCRHATDAWARDHAKGWEAVVRELGIEPGSEQARRVRRAFVGSFDRWNRPIELDGALRREFAQPGQRAYLAAPPAED